MSASDSSKHILENDFLRIVVADKGAELQSLFIKDKNIELLWQAGEAWPKHAPVLFPVVGQLKNNSATHFGKPVTLSRHGFARDSIFTLVYSSNSELHFELYENETSLQVFPFRFRFLLKYLLKDSALIVSMQAVNVGNEILYCSYGAHPAFRIPMNENESFEDYELVFTPADHFIHRWPLDKNLISDIPLSIAIPHGRLPLSRDLFAADAMVIKKPSFEAVALQNSKTGFGIKMTCSGWPYFGIWSAPGGDFVCLEPWQGIADTVHSTGEFSQKEGILAIEPGKSHETSFTLTSIG
jgi:galactose mutarotase-like enzyme